MIGKARATFWDNLPAQNDKSFKSKAYFFLETALCGL